MSVHGHKTAVNPSEGRALLTLSPLPVSTASLALAVGLQKLLVLSPAAAFAMPAGSRGPGCSAAPRRAGTSRRPGAHLASSTGSRLCHLHRGPAHVHSCDTPASRRVLENILLNFPAAGGQEGRKGRTCARRPLLSERGGGFSPARRSAWKRGDAGGCSEGPSSGGAGEVAG